MLVVIGIIAVLTALGFSSYSTAQKKSRDAKRKSDLKEIQNAFEQYYSICGYRYPTSLGNSIICTSPSTAIMPTVPKDPKTNNSYNYSGTNSSYSICANSSEIEPTPCVRNLQ